MKYDNFDSFRRSALRAAFEKYREQLSLCRLGFVEGSVHDLRVAIRRFLATVDLFDTIRPLKYFKAIRRDMKRKLKAFNALRDAHVMLLQVKDTLYKFPILQLYYHELVSREQLLVLQLKSDVEKFDDSYVEDALYLIGLFFRSNGYDGYTKEEARKALRSARDLFLSRLSEADPLDFESIHKARIAFKRFRYMAEALSGELRVSKESKKQMNEYQTLMGEIQDSEVFLNDFKKFVKKASKENRMQLKEALNYYESERDRLVMQFFERKEEFPIDMDSI